jgi:hypothetical protein
MKYLRPAIIALPALVALPPGGAQLPGESERGGSHEAFADVSRFGGTASICRKPWLRLSELDALG